MARYHISSNGKPSICRATKESCPLGTDSEHFSSRKEAQKYSEQVNSEMYGVKNSVNKIDNDNNENSGNTVKNESYQMIRGANVLVDDVDEDVVVASYIGSGLSLDNNGKVRPEDTVYSEKTLANINKDLESARNSGVLDNSYEYKAFYNHDGGEVIVNRIIPGSRFSRFDNIEIVTGNTKKDKFTHFKEVNEKNHITRYRPNPNKQNQDTINRLERIANSYRYAEVAYDADKVSNLNNVNVKDIDMGEVKLQVEEYNNATEYDERIVNGYSNYETVVVDSYESGDAHAVERETSDIVSKIAKDSPSNEKSMRDSLYTILQDKDNLDKISKMNDYLIEDKAAKDIENDFIKRRNLLNVEHKGNPSPQTVQNTVKEIEYNRDQIKEKAHNQKNKGREQLEKLRTMSQEQFSQQENSSRTPIIDNILTRAQQHKQQKEHNQETISIVKENRED